MELSKHDDEVFIIFMIDEVQEYDVNAIYHES